MRDRRIWALALLGLAGTGWLRERRARRQLARENSLLQALNTIHEQIVEAVTLDELFDVLVTIPAQVVAGAETALVLYEPSGPVCARTTGAAVQAAALRAQPTMLGVYGDILCVPLRDDTIAIGHLAIMAPELPERDSPWAQLLERSGRISGEAITSSRRRAREERELYALERAIAEERARIARDIHDGLAQTLAFRRMRIDLWLDWLASDPERLGAELLELKDMLRSQIAELRRAIFALRPIEFDALGFTGGMQQFIRAAAANHGWTLELQIEPIPHLTPVVEATCFRIVQEALNNSAKHAGASAVSVIIAGRENGLALTISDDGCGFEPREQRGDGLQLGLTQMRERVAAAGGWLRITSGTSTGTTIAAWLPIIPEEDLS